jgi:hypothetical protein
LPETFTCLDIENKPLLIKLFNIFLKQLRLRALTASEPADKNKVSGSMAASLYTNFSAAG